MAKKIHDPINYAFDKSKQSRKREYFSGANVRVYFGDIWVEELASISFQMEEQITPIYGFNSYQFDKMARGTRLVSGSFTLSFTENGYLQTILDRISSGIDVKNDMFLRDTQEKELKLDIGETSSSRAIQNILEMSEGETYKGYIDSLKDSFWGTDSVSGNTVTRTSISREYDTHYYSNVEGSKYENPLKEHGFNILIDFSPDANSRDFMECIKQESGGKSAYRTLRSIIGVHITGEGQEMAPDGQVLRQTFTFLARDLDGDVTELSLKNNYRNKSEKTFKKPVHINPDHVEKPLDPSFGIQHLR